MVQQLFWAAAAAERFGIGRLLVRQQARVLVRQQLLEWDLMQLLGRDFLIRLAGLTGL